MRLSDDNIEKTAEDIRLFFANASVSKDDCIRICILAEEAMLCYQKEFGEEYEFSITKRRWLGVPKVVIRLQGKPFDPLKAEDKAALPRHVIQNLMNYEKAETIYSYQHGCNEISILATKERKHLKIPGGTITVTILLAVLCALLIGQLPEDTQATVLRGVADPMLENLMGLITAITGPFVFISVAAGICAMEDISVFSTVGLKVVRYFWFFMFLSCLFAAGVGQLFFPVLSLDGDANVDFFQIFGMLLDILPKNFFAPFVEGNILQIVFIAFLCSGCILQLANFLPNVKNVIYELNKLIFRMLDVISKVIYVAIFLNVLKILVDSDLATILGAWKIIAATYVFTIGFAVAMLLFIAFRYKVSIREFLRKGSKTFMTALSTGNETMAMTPNMEFARNGLKLDGKFCDFCLPLSNALFRPTPTSSLVIAVFYAAYLAGTPLPLSSMVVVIFLSMQLSIAIPPGAGGIMAVYALLFHQIGLPTDSIGMLMVAGVFADNVSSSMSMIIQDCTLVAITGGTNTQQSFSPPAGEK